MSTHSTVIPGQGNDDLQSLVEEVRSGRKAALERLIFRVQGSVRRWAARFASDEDAAEDVAQDVLIGLERRVQRFDGASRFSTWLFTVTRNVALSRRRRDARRAALAEQHRLAGDEVVDRVDPDAARLVALALRYFDGLPPQQRRIFELVDIRGFTPAEVARRLSMEQSTVRGHLFKARRAIRERLLEHHERLLKEYRS